MPVNLLHFAVDRTAIEQQQVELSDMARLLLYERYPQWFEFLDYDDDTIFLNPALIYLFSEQASSQIPIEQLLFGYIPDSQKPTVFQVLSDPFGEIYLPNVGYLKTAIKSALVALNYSDNVFNIQQHTYGHEAIFCQEKSRENLPILCSCLPFNLYLSIGKPGDVLRPVANTLSIYYRPLNRAFDLLKKHVPAFWDLLVLTTREVCVFESHTLRSMAAVSYQGTAFINTESQAHDEVFFIEDLAHQCGHIMFYLLTWNAGDFLAIPKNTPLKDIVSNKNETRNVYGAFHGLFTYTTILHCLHECLLVNAFTESQALEVHARIGFFMWKFSIDIDYFNRIELFTKKGWEFYKAFRACFETMHRKYKPVYRDFQYQTQPYIFSFTHFCSENQLSL